MNSEQVSLSVPALTLGVEELDNGDYRAAIYCGDTAVYTGAAVFGREYAVEVCQRAFGAHLARLCVGGGDMFL